MSFLNKILGAPKADYRKLVADGAGLVDVRTRNEFKAGNAPGSVNLPLQEINSWKEHFKSGDKVVLVCRSGARAMQAKGILSGHGVEVYNAGAWQNMS